MLIAHVFGGKQDIAKDSFVVLDMEAFVFVCPAKGALVMGAPKRHLQKYAMGFAGRPNDGSLVVHFFRFSHSSLS
jgi:hypothetical protein